MVSNTQAITLRKIDGNTVAGFRREGAMYMQRNIIELLEIKPIYNCIPQVQTEECLFVIRREMGDKKRRHYEILKEKSVSCHTSETVKTET